MNDIAQGILKKADQAFGNTERTNQQSNWELLAEFILPNQSGIFNGLDTPGGKKTRRLYDSTAIQANSDLAAAIHSTLTNPATRWSKLRYKQEDLNNDREAIAWLEEVNKEIHSNINESTFDTMVSKNYQSFSSLGTMVLYQEEKTNEAGIFEGFGFEAIHLSQVAFSENKNGIVDCVYRKFSLTARQAMEKFGNDNPDCIKESVENSPEKEFEFYHVVMPRDKKQVKQGMTSAKNRAYASYYICKKEAKIVKEGGYYEFPFYVTRWQTMPGETYGRGPGHIALPDVRTLNTVKEHGLHAIAKAVNPPIMAEQRSILGNLDLRPGQLTIVRNLDGLKEFVTQSRYDVTQFAVEDLRNAIKSIFFIDKLFLPPRTETGEMTAFEIDQRLAQMQRVLGPTLSRLNSEFLSPLIIRSFKILLRAGMLPEVPEILKERGIDVEIGFVNQLSRAQQIEELSSVQAWVRDTAELAQLNPEVLDLINFDEVSKFSAKIRGISEKLVSNEDAVEERRQQRAQAAQAQQQLEAGIGVADIISKTGGLEGGQ